MASLKFAHDTYEILNGRNIAVIGTFRGANNSGCEVYKALKQADYNVYAVDPKADYLNGDTVYPCLDNVPGKLDCVVAALPPESTYEIVRQAGQLHVPHVWMQPGSESVSAIIEAQALGIGAVYGGPCIMREAARYRTENQDGEHRNERNDDDE